MTTALATPAEIVDEARNGRMFILVDDEDRENEGDLVMPAQMATPDAINFMALHGRGLICLALTQARADKLGLKPMSVRNGCAHGTAFTTSIEARTGVTTGISAGDRARTTAVAIDAACGPEDIVTPGHVFPLVARDGGVLVRAGHTEAAVDVARLAGLNPSGVICEIMNDDGSMARLPDLAVFAERHGLKIGTIRDLIAYRMRHDHLVRSVAEASFDSVHGGRWTARTYRNEVDGSEHVALLKGAPPFAEPVLVRMHASSPFNDVFGERHASTGLLQAAMEEIGEEGVGVVVVVRGATPAALSNAFARRAASMPLELREYGVGAQILAGLGIHRLTLLTNSQRLPVSIAGYGIEIVERRALAARLPGPAREPIMETHDGRC
ncbi:3,4-dihydroxy-2-butanone-4-phosphate synthase [Sphingomonas sp. TREG-RG-20F-R18-01]|uniref:3,4-dihydroxy-2-butanone-4-phosphate synthase n=1 Tax=Sphingomonas sp. TREG-RG-20F-R18-01 TaxID=2914982 RepID=UPI001F58FE7C|nr:3,4-dihydroxy-2-butanone-4-phosphate synthase [Sphingomonas sp. TREG-RG-20F-R18-01]